MSKGIISRTSTVFAKKEDQMKSVPRKCFYCGRDMRKHGEKRYGGVGVCDDCYEYLVSQEAHKGRS